MNYARHNCDNMTEHIAIRKTVQIDKAWFRAGFRSPDTMHLYFALILYSQAHSRDNLFSHQITGQVKLQFTIHLHEVTPTAYLPKPGQKVLVNIVNIHKKYQFLFFTFL